MPTRRPAMPGGRSTSIRPDSPFFCRTSSQQTSTLDTFEPHFSLPPAQPSEEETIQTPQHRPDGLLRPSKLPAGFSGSDGHLSTSLPALAGTQRCCVMAAAHAALQRRKVKPVFMFTQESCPQRKRPREEGYGASPLSKRDIGYGIKIPRSGTRSVGAEVQGDALGRAEGLSLALVTAGGGSRAGVAGAWHRAATVPAKPFPADEM